MYRFTFLSLFSLLYLSASAQKTQYVERLAGIMPGQYRDAVIHTYGTPADSGRYEDHFSWYAYHIIAKGEDYHLLFEFSADYPELVWSVSVSGARCSHLFQGLQLGEGTDKIVALYGKPSHVVKLSPYTGERWTYDSLNCIFEWHDAALSSVKIIQQGGQFFQQADTTRIPPLAELIAACSKAKPERLLPYLAPDIEINDQGIISYFDYDIDTELELDKSGIFGSLMDAERGLPSLKDKDIYTHTQVLYDEAGRAKVRMQFPESAPIAEISFRYYMGTYRIWEVKLREDPDEEDMDK